MTVSTSINKSGPYAGSGTTGPFTVTFPFLDNTHLRVIRTSTAGVDTDLVLTTDYTVTGAGGTSGTVTLVSALQTGERLTIVRNVPITQETDYVASDNFPAESHERALDKLTMIAGQLAEELDRSVKLPASDTTDVDALTADLMRLADSADNIDAVANALANVNTVASDLLEPVSEINTVAGSIANVDAVGGSIASVNTVSASIANVNTTAGAISNVNAVGTNIASVNTTAGSIGNVNTTAAAISNVNAVGGAINNVNTVASSIANVNTTATNIASVNTVAGNNANVTTVAGSIASVNTTAGNIANVNTVAGNNTNVTTVATNIASVQTNAANISAIQGAAANAASVSAALSQVQNGAKQRFVAGVNYTINVATQLTLSSTPAKAGMVQVYFDGVYQNSDRWSLAGAVITFVSAIPASVVEVAYDVPATMPDDANWRLMDERARDEWRRRFNTPIKPTLLLDFAGDEILDPRVTFTRSSEGRFYDGRTFAKAEENLLTFSQEFDNAAWNKFSGSITANTSAAPDGTTTADTFTADGTSNIHGVGPAASQPAGAKTASFFVKAGTATFVQIYFGSDTNSFANFNITAGAGAVGTVGSSTTASIVSLGNDWYRVIATTSASAATGANLAIVTSASAARAESNASTGTVLLWGAQLEIRSTVTAYTPTTTQPITRYQPQLMTAASNVARFDHNPTTGESLGLLIEEQRTNLLLRSEQFADAAWTKTNTTVAANVVVAPDGTLTADKVSLAAATGQSLMAQSFSFNANTTYVLTVFAKRGELQYVNVGMWINGFNYGGSQFDLASGTHLRTAGTGSNYTYSGGSITHVGNGWYRCQTIIAMGGVSGAASFGAWPSNAIWSSGDISQTLTGDGFSGIFIWGAQLEAGAFPTSYIPTTSAQVTRSADDASMTGTNFSSWYRQDEGTVYTETQKTALVPSGTNSRLATFRNAAGTFGYFVRQGSSDIAFQDGVDLGIAIGPTPVSGTVYKAAGALRMNDCAFSVNGSAVSTDTSTASLRLDGSVDRLVIGSSGSSQYANGHLRRLAYYPTRLANSVLQSITA